MKRLEVRLSQRELAAKIGTDQAHISRITVQTLVKLADVLRVSTDYLLGRNATSTSLVEPTIGTGSSQRRKKTKSCP
jgi:transcriptional regulator with XRE-family HTH domain